MHPRPNPFTTLYVTERMENDVFPALFSPILVPQVLQLFQAGNVVIRGTQGTGKSMLLALLRTDIRLAFEGRRDVEYPVDLPQRHFVSAGINLATNQALRFASRWKKDADQTALRDLQDGFIDFVNTWLLRDLLQSIRALQTSRWDVWKRYKLGKADVSIDDSVAVLGRTPIVKQLLRKPRTFDDADAQLSERLEKYLLFLDGKSTSLSHASSDLQTGPVGRPIKLAVDALRESGCLSRSTAILITIDQFEQLLDFEVQVKGRHFSLLRDAIEDALHLREPTVCYRIGTRPYAWKPHRGERLRDYMEVDLDDLLRRKEYTRAPLFPALAEDVFRRRLQCFEYSELAAAKDPIAATFGASPSRENRIARFASAASPNRLLGLPESVPTQVRETLERLAAERLLSAKLGAAWVQQRLTASALERDPAAALASIVTLPWEAAAKKWWKKERLELAVLQVAAACGQRVPMYGKKDILDLSGSNVLVFGSICQHVWACWIRAVSVGKQESRADFLIEPVLQDEGIRKASVEWHKKMSEEPWLGDSITQFVDVLGNFLHSSLVDDKAMSYPGGNGISVPDRELGTFPEVEQILLDATDRGFLLRRQHTPKKRSRGPSTKWYLHPVLSPYFELTVGHTKEPLYVTGRHVRRWMEQAGLVPAREAHVTEEADGYQRRLPGLDGGG